MIPRPSNNFLFSNSPGQPRGSALVLTMVVLILLSGLALTLAQAMRTEAIAGSNDVARLQAQTVADGAIEYVRTLLEGISGQAPEDSDIQCQAASIAGGWFWLLKHDPDRNDSISRFGLNDESAKLHLNFAGAAELSLLPGSNTTIAASIVDWHDTDDSAQTSGAESAYYLALATPYRAKNSSFETVEELRMVRDITQEVLWGEDANRNGRLDPNENDGTLSDPPDNRDGKLEPGIAACTTVYSQHPNTSADGQRRVNVNTASPSQLRRTLTGALSGDRLNNVVSASLTNRPYRHLLDYQDRVGLNNDEFRKLADLLTTSSNTQLRGLINLNTASRTVLMCLTGIGSSDADAIVAHRSGNSGYSTLADLVDALSKTKAMQIADRVTTRSYQYAADVIAVDPTGRSFVRYWVVFDAQQSPPRILYRADWTSLGWPLDRSILTDLRAGRTPEAAQRTFSLSNALESR